MPLVGIRFSRDMHNLYVGAILFDIFGPWLFSLLKRRFRPSIRYLQV